MLRTASPCRGKTYDLAADLTKGIDSNFSTIRAVTGLQIGAAMAKIVQSLGYGLRYARTFINNISTSAAYCFIQNLFNSFLGVFDIIDINRYITRLTTRA